MERAGVASWTYTTAAAMNYYNGHFRTRQFWARNSTTFFSETEFDHDNDCGCDGSRRLSPAHTHGLVSCNDVHRNVLYQVSAAQVERMKTYRVVRLPSSSRKRNYELVKQLEAVAASHSTSVPVVIQAWRKERGYGSWQSQDERIFDDDDEDYNYDEEEEDEYRYYRDADTDAEIIDMLDILQIAVSLSREEVMLLNKTLTGVW